MEGHLKEKEEENSGGEPDQGDSGGVSRENSSPSHEGSELLSNPKRVSE